MCEIELTFWLAIKLGAGLALGWIAVSLIWGGLFFILQKPLMAFVAWWMAD
jgi:hypothetical protein